MFKFLHNNLNVLDLERSLKFYKEALDELQKREPENKHYKEFAERFVKYNQ